MIELDRPAVRPGPRLPGWAVMALVWGGSWAALIVLYGLLSSSGPAVSPWLVVTIALGALAASIVAGVAAMRLRSGGSVWSNALESVGEPIGDPEGGRRPSDAEERAAWRALRKGRLSRVEYERIAARRRYAHGDISYDEFHAISRQLDAAEHLPRPSNGSGR